MSDSDALGYPLLFSPLTLRGRTLKNRIVHASMTTRYLRDGIPTDAFHYYYLNRARGGSAAIVTEPMNLCASQVAPTRASVFDGRAMGEVARLADACREFDCHLIVQVQDRGRGRHEGGRVDEAYGASPLPDDISWTVPHAMSVGQIQAMIGEMAESCRKLADIGFAGGEVSAGHGHLLHQFLSPWSNKRDDDYGGDLAGRMRFLRELMLAIRAACPDDFLIGVKLPGYDGVANSIGVDAAQEIACEVHDIGVADFWSFAWGSHANSLYQHLPDAHLPPVPYAEATRQIRSAAPDMPTGALGYILDPSQAERQLSDGSADFILLGRALIADPHWPRKVIEQREPEIRYCVSCNSCWRAIIESNHLACDNNPRVGMDAEGDWHPQTAPSREHYVVVGSGVAGLEAAWVLAEAGHKVTVLGAGDSAGGVTRVHAELPGGENLSSIYDYQYLRLQRTDAALEFGVRATQADIEALKPDAVILATGSHLSTPDWLDEAWQEMVPDLRQMCRDFLPRPVATDGRLVVWDYDHTEMTYAAAQYFAGYFDEVVLITSRERIASDVALVTRQGINKRLNLARVRIVTYSEPTGVDALEEGRFEFRNIFNGDVSAVDDIAGITYATPRLPNDSLYQPLTSAGISTHLIGDAFAPRTVMSATHEGHQLALRLLAQA
ncbi:MAG: NAD(P)-binding protein [Pseudomonadota bacterium]